jgi:phosphate transport system substrate-binding protein
MRRLLSRGGGLFVAALAILALGITTGASATTPSATKLASATLDGSGSSFQYPFDQVVIGGFKQLQNAVTINYQSVGSGQGRTDFANGVTDFAGSDAPYKDTDPQPDGKFFYFPLVNGPITVSYNLPGVKGLKLSPDTIAKIFQGEITTWDDAAIKAENPKAKLPSTTITVAHRSDGSGTTENFTKFLVKAAPDTWTLGSGATVAWPSSTQGGKGNSGVANIVKSTEGGIGYVDYSDAKASDLQLAMVQNAAGKYKAPTLKGTTAAADGAEIQPDLVYDPTWAQGAAAYPIASPTWIMVMADQTDAAKGAAIKGFLNYIYSQGQKAAPSVDYAPLPKSLLKKAKAQVKQITVPSS